MPQAPKTLNKIESLIQIVQDLRGPEGCPWDKEQTHTSLTPYAIEEVFEMVEAIESGDDNHACEELGDVLFQVILHATIAEERGAYNIQDVIQSISSKIVRRHPHVFSDVKVKDSNDVIKNWDEIKKLEKHNKPEKKDFFNIPKGLPALQASTKIGEKTERYKFDWSATEDVLKQLKSEIQELEDAMKNQNLSEIQHEIGDVLFSAAQVARHLKTEPETDLRIANKRFIQRFEKMLENKTIEQFTALSSNEKENLWKMAKASLKK